ncbi:DNA polymerase III subunit alpha [Patescibacteria group bacterium]|nr:DNA polymerase III subunit alpha [Patescibacteria group bacterium]MBU4512871.1 DNA polymerase III subunit alpha [Patescibacteria group bacterium]MCG2693148.1 DNA polymerase III subunit alpha [Candidatus Parcubacteria bacterium]
MKFTHLHTHSHYSLLDGLPKIDELVAKAKKCNMDSLALTDHGVMYGAIEFYKTCKEADIKPIIGVEFYVAPNGRLNKQPRIDEERHHLVLLAKNEIGYKNLLKLTTKAHLEGFYYKPRIDLELIRKYNDGLIACSACLQGEIPKLIITGKKDKAKEIALEYNQIYGAGNFYLEVQHHPNLPEQKTVNDALFEISKELGIPCVAANDIHYLESDDDKAQDILLCLQTKKKLEDTDRMNMTGEDFSFRTSEQMIEDFREHPEVIENTQKIASACNLKIELGKVKLPHFDVPSGITDWEYLKKLCYKGVQKRYDVNMEADLESNRSLTLSETGEKINPQIIKERLDYELGVIKKTGFTPYFLIVADFVNWAKDNNIIVGPGRGSAAGSIVSYLLNITNIDPLKYNLLFERFLNPERISMPDIDLDFADTRRDEVIEYVSQKYGRDHVSQIITFGTMAARAAVRDVGRVLGMSYTYCDQMAKMVPAFSNLEKALEINAELKQAYDNNPEAKKLIDMAKKLEGVARHASTHACGVVITREPLVEYIPLQYDSKALGKTIISQFSMKPIEDLGLLKMDFLGLKNLTTLENTLKIVKYTRGTEIDIDEIPLNDEKTFKLFRHGDTTGVFQLESSGMKRYLVQLKPTELEDIIAMVALYRPGPIEWIPDYIAGKHGKKKTNYLHPKLTPILEKTHGVAIYQEQVMQIARDLAGFSLGEADILRKAVGKKIPKLLAKQKEEFIAGCIENGISKEIAQKIFAFIEPFAGYGFNRSHAACYAMIAYLTAYLKANYPQEFMASLLTSDQHDTDRIAIEVEECRKMGLEILPPDINESFKRFTVVQNPNLQIYPGEIATDSVSRGESESTNDTHNVKKAIRFGLLAIKNVGENIIETIIRERQENGTFQTLEDFLQRVQTKNLNKKSLESLIKSGALDSFAERNQMLSNMDNLLNYNKNIQKEKNNNQTNLFGLMGPDTGPSLRLEPAEEAPERKKLSWEKELLGLYISEHPFREFENYTKGITTSCREIQQLSQKTSYGSVKTAGVITNIQKITTRSNEPMLFVKIEDTSGALEILVFPKLLKQTNEIWHEEKIVIIAGKPSDKDGVIKILSDNVWELNHDNLDKILEEVKKTTNKNGYTNGYANYNNGYNNYTTNNPNNNQQSPNQAIKIIMPPALNQELGEKLKSLLKASPPGQHKVYLLFPHVKGAETRKIATNFFLNLNDELKIKIEQILGMGTVTLDKF